MGATNSGSRKALPHRTHKKEKKQRNRKAIRRVITYTNTPSSLLCCNEEEGLRRYVRTEHTTRRI